MSLAFRWDRFTRLRLSACLLICHKGHTDTIQVYSVTVMTHVKALQAGHSSQGTSEPITPVSVSHPADQISHPVAIYVNHIDQ